MNYISQTMLEIMGAVAMVYMVAHKDKLDEIQDKFISKIRCLCKTK